MKGTRDTKRQERRRNQVPSVSIAGYTNAGKSCLLNRLTGAGVLVEDALFATLDPTTRRTTTTDGRVYTMSDTVGFVRHLPHQLVEAFRSTLEEVADVRPDPARRRRLPPRPRGPARRRPRGVRRDRRRRGARARRHQQGRRGRPDGGRPAGQREPHCVVVSAHTGEGIARGARDHRVRAAAPRRGVRGAAALRARRPDQPAPPARRDRLAGAHRRRAPSSPAGPTPTSPASWRRTPSDQPCQAALSGGVLAAASARAIRWPRMPNANMIGRNALPSEVTWVIADREREHQREQHGRQHRPEPLHQQCHAQHASM